MIIYLGADHRGFKLKEKIKAWLHMDGYNVEDLGNTKLDTSDDYPDFASKVAKKISENPDEHKGIVFCGSGVGVDIVANRFSGVRCAVAINRAQVEAASRDDHVNVLAIASDFLPEAVVQEVILAWLMNQHKEQERHMRRIEKIEKITDENNTK